VTTEVSAASLKSLRNAGAAVLNREWKGRRGLSANWSHNTLENDKGREGGGVFGTRVNNVGIVKKEGTRAQWVLKGTSASPSGIGFAN